MVNTMVSPDNNPDFSRTFTPAKAQGLGLAAGGPGIDATPERENERKNTLAGKLAKVPVPAGADKEKEHERKLGDEALLAYQKKVAWQKMLTALQKDDMKTLHETLPQLTSHKDEQGNTPLHLAARMGKAGLVRDMVGMGYDMNAKNAAGMEPLHEAYANKQVHCAEAMVKMGANPNRSDGNGKTINDYLAKVDHVSENHKKTLRGAGLEGDIRSGQELSPHLALEQDVQGNDGTLSPGHSLAGKNSTAKDKLDKWRLGKGHKLKTRRPA